MADEPQAKKPRTDSDCDKAPDAVKEEEQDAVKEEETKDAAKEGANDEGKNEVKEEVKVEVENRATEEVGEDDNADLEELFDAVAEDTGGAGTKKKKKKTHESEPEEQDLPDVDPVETDSEYQEVDIQDYPARLKVEQCSYVKINGLYRKLPKPSRGRPSYCNTGGNKPVYLYSYKSKWHFGFDFGARKCVAQCPEVEGVPLPVEPYVNSWKVMPKSDKKEDKDKGEDKGDKKKPCLAMRVIDCAFLEESHVFEGSDLIIPDEVMAPSVRTSADVGEKPEESSPADSKTKKKKTKSEPAGSPQQTSSSASKPSNGGQGSGDDDAAMVAAYADEQSSDEEKAAPAPAQDNADDSDSNANDSDSSEEESSSSESEQDAQPAAQAPAGSDPEQAFSPQVKSLISKLKEDKEGKGKAARLIQQMRKNPSKANRFTPVEVEQIVGWCCRHFGIPDVPPDSAAPKTPPATNQPTTPPMEAGATNQVRRPVNDVMPHRMPFPNLKSVMRPPGRGRNFKRFIHFNQRMERVETAIVTFKNAGDGLWHQQPGAMVQCDYCERSVPQAMGSLQGAPGQSQFAQCAFVCNDCAGRHM
eukprot:TRINITY_DN5518_c0_g1_i1.p1 TRINITY_DN5518_c0_g1~~TRINITY_DN5518_c0_g1_i1.p1  ORF type:complete len:586 (-),score=150.98 TRINITY_DN5518_c0_g1_i1:86-1843(-)